MVLFTQIILIFTQISLFITTIQVYLQINKIWKRKHEREVAASQSIAGLTLLMANCMLWILYYIYVEDDILSLLDTSLYLLQSFVFLLISTGLWVRGQERLGLWSLARKALRLERKEANFLIKRFFKPTNAEAILNILHQIAMIDDYLDPKEEELLDAFAKEWHIDYSGQKLKELHVVDSQDNYIKLRLSLNNYLKSDPPKDQVAQLKDMINALINADDKVTSEEELMNEELNGLIDNFLSKGNNINIYEVLIVPQQSNHDNLIKDLVPNAKKTNISGGVAYSIGEYYSLRYAEMITRQYREINLFTIVHSANNTEPTR